MLGIHTFWFYGIMLRIIEFIETIIFVLRKKQNQVTFLHVYHHISTIIIFWVFLKYSGSEFTIQFFFKIKLIKLIKFFPPLRHDGALPWRSQLTRSCFHVLLLSSQLSEFRETINDNGKAFFYPPPTDTILHHSRSLFNRSPSALRRHSPLLHSIS